MLCYVPCYCSLELTLRCMQVGGRRVGAVSRGCSVYGLTAAAQLCYVLHGPLQLYSWWYFVQYENWRCGSLFCIWPCFWDSSKWGWFAVGMNVSWSETKFFNCLTGSCHLMCVRLLTISLVASDLLCFYCIISILCAFLYFVLNFLHCSTGQKLMLSERCILSILLFPFIYIVYLVYDFIIK